MAFGESIVAYFGGDISGLKKACSDAAAEVDNLNQRMGSRVESGLARSFLGLSAIRAVRGWASEAIKAAQDTRDEFEKLGIEYAPVGVACKFSTESFNEGRQCRSFGFHG